MQYPGYTDGIKSLVKGNFYPFKIHNVIQLQDEEFYYILLDVNGMKHFLPARFYSNYNLEPGNEIICRVDKINCTGRIILEPLHPYYKENFIYGFGIESFSKNQGEVIVKVTDIYGNKIEITSAEPEMERLLVNRKVNCLVKNIKKGLPELVIV